ncbi:phage scaffolding protein [Sporosarcina sp. FSL K6-2383]|uniref:phage scaffolding protein n=1 Tax=Sporosarcina sp. FSL K6-2383 TaxID=2921556 RepID=UPI00315AEF3A
MNREALKEMGLTDEQIDKVMASHGSVVNATKGELAAMTTERDDLKGQLTERDTQLNDLSAKVKDNDDLTAEIDRLKGENATATTDLQAKLDGQAFDFALEKALTGAKVRNPKALKALLDTEKIKLDGETLLNLEDQLTTLKESDSYLFDTEEAPPNSPAIVTPGNPNGGENTPSDPFAAKLAKYN